MLDIKDRKIIYHLDLNCRQSLQEIGKKVHLSKESVFYRIKKLENRGIIQGYSAIVDLGKLGYTTFRIFLRFQNITTKKEEEIIRYLKEQKIIGWFVSVEGNWDLNIWLICKSIKELDEFWRKFNNRYMNYIDKVNLSVFTDITYFSMSYLIGSKTNTHRFRFVTLPKKENVDDIDLRILERLSKNSRMSTVEIAQHIGISPKTVSNRIRGLERRKIIIGYKPLIDISKIGYLYYKIHLKLSKINERDRKAFRTYVFNHPNIVYDNTTIGGPDLEIDVHVENAQKLRGVIGDIKDRFSENIRYYEILHYLKVHKYLPFPANINRTE